MVEQSLHPPTVFFRLLLLLLTILLNSTADGKTGGAQDNTIRYHVEEEQPAGTRVGNVVVDAGLRRRFPKDVLALLEYRFKSEPPPIPLVIGLNDGIIRTSGIIDRDSMSGCRQRDSCDVLLDVTVQPLNYFDIVKIAIEVIDVNDNSPRFDTVPSGLAILSVLESASVGSTFLLPSATDPDSPAFGVHRYEIVSADTASTSKFGVIVTPKLDGFLDVRLRLIERLDREQRDEYRLRLVAYDGGRPARSGTVNVTIRVMDANDNDPVFDRQSYEAIIVENQIPTAPIVRVRAVDVDIGDNGRVVYGFASQTRSLYGRTFHIDNRTGEIYLREPVDREMTAVYQLIVTAEDAGPDSHPVDTTVTVSVADVNDNRPSIVVNTLAAVGADRAAVPENAAPGTFVAHMTVADPDAGRNGTVNCSLVGADGAFVLEERSLLHQPETEYQVLTAVALDREVTAGYELSIACVDLGDPPQRSIKLLPVDVSDENDNCPVFGRPVYTALLTENNHKGAVVVYVNATDPDEAENGTIAKYSIVGDENSKLFAVDHRGLVTAIEALDREKGDVRRVQILAVDRGSPPQTSSALIVVSVDDVDDETPNFSKEKYIMSVPENRPPGERVGVVMATDGDLPPYNVVRYSFALENQATDCFSIDPVNGTLITRCRLDRESHPVYYLTVAATNPSLLGEPASPPPTGSGTASVVVHVGDVNDNAPVFDFPSPHHSANDTIAVSSATPVGHEVLRLSARDADDDANGRIVYRLQSEHHVTGHSAVSGGGSTDSIFIVDPILGTLHVSRSLRHIDHAVFRLVVVAEDGGRPEPLSTSGQLTIIVNRTIPFVPPGSASSSDSRRLSVGMSVVVGSSLGAVGLLLIIVVVLLVIYCSRRRSAKSTDPSGTDDVDCSRMTEGVKMLTSGGRDASSPESTPVKRSTSQGLGATNELYSSKQPREESVSNVNGQPRPVNGSILSDDTCRRLGGQSIGGGCAGSVRCVVDDDPESRQPAAITAATLGSTVRQRPPGSNGSVWQPRNQPGRSMMSTSTNPPPSASSSMSVTMHGCSYGVGSPCCKLLPTAAQNAPAAARVPYQHQQPLRAQTLPRGRPAVVSGDVAARLRPPPPPAASAVRQAVAAAAAQAAGGSAATGALRPARLTDAWSTEAATSAVGPEGETTRRVFRTSTGNPGGPLGNQDHHHQQQQQPRKSISTVIV